MSVIQKGTEERLEVLKSKKKQVEEGESSAEPVPRLIGHIEKVEEEEIEDEQEGDKAVAVDDLGAGQTAGKDTEQIDETPTQKDKNKKADETEDPKKKTRSTPSITKLK